MVLSVSYNPNISLLFATCNNRNNKKKRKRNTNAKPNAIRKENTILRNQKAERKLNEKKTRN